MLCCCERDEQTASRIMSDYNIDLGEWGVSSVPALMAKIVDWQGKMLLLDQKYTLPLLTSLKNKQTNKQNKNFNKDNKTRKCYVCRESHVYCIFDNDAWGFVSNIKLRLMSGIYWSYNLRIFKLCVMPAYIV